MLPWSDAAPRSRVLTSPPLYHPLRRSRREGVLRQRRLPLRRRHGPPRTPGLRRRRPPHPDPSSLRIRAPPPHQQSPDRHGLPEPQRRRVVAGYRAVMEAANASPRFFAGQMTAAGKVRRRVPPFRRVVGRAPSLTSSPRCSLSLSHLLPARRSPPPRSSCSGWAWRASRPSRRPRTWAP